MSSFEKITVKVDKEKPTLSITSSTTEIIHDDIVLTAKGSDKFSGIKRIKDPDGNWHSQNEMTYTVKHNGTYSFVTEDYAGNQTTETFTVTNIDLSISFEIPAVSDIKDITLTDQPTTYATDMTSIKVKDWREADNDWRLEVSASRMKMRNGDFELPTGTVQIKPLSMITQIEGNNNLPMKSTTVTKVIDDGIVMLAEGNNSRGEFDLNFPNSALELLIDPTTTFINDFNGTTYEITISWDLVTAP